MRGEGYEGIDVNPQPTSEQRLKPRSKSEFATVEISLTYPKDAKLVSEILDINDSGISFRMNASDGFLYPGAVLKNLKIYHSSNGREPMLLSGMLRHISLFRQGDNFFYKMGLEFLGKRSFDRIELTRPVKVQDCKVGTASFQDTDAKSSDINERGVGISLDRPPALTSVKLKIEGFQSNSIVELPGKIKWVASDMASNSFRCGVEFNEPQHWVVQQLREDTIIKRIEDFLKCSLPPNIKTNMREFNMFRRVTKPEIMEVIDFTSPFLKLERMVVGCVSEQERLQSYGLATGVVTPEDTKGHYYNTIFLALCGWLMASAASVHLAVLAPGTAPQVVEAVGVRPFKSLNDKRHIWKPASEGTRFFVETWILKKRLNLAIVKTIITFSNVVYGTVDELKLVITPRDTILNAKVFPVWDGLRA